MPFVVDNSVVIAWFFPSQATDYTGAGQAQGRHRPRSRALGA